MPELPEVETTKRGVEPYLLNNRITKCWHSGLSLRVPFDSSKFNLIKNDLITGIDRIAKYIVLHFKNKNRLVIHLGMTGNLRVSNFLKKVKHDHIVMNLKNGNYLIYNDPRRFGLVSILAKEEQFTMLDNNADDPFSTKMTPKLLLSKIKNKNTTIKAILLNNKIISGIGNIYACEVLFSSGISPFTLGKDIDLEQCKEILKNAKKILNSAIKSGGTTLKDYFNAEAKPGYFKIKLKVYDREGQKCAACKSLIARSIQNNRSTFHCLNCQS